MKLKCYTVIFSFLALEAFGSTTPVVKDFPIERTEVVKLQCLGFDDQVKEIPIRVMDTLSGHVRGIFSQMLDDRFPIYAASCYAPKTLVGNLPSLHAYAAAVDINYLMNPYVDLVNFKIIPTRLPDRVKERDQMRKELKEINISESETEAIFKFLDQPDVTPPGSDDRFLNRSMIRKGMVTPEVVKLFKINGFNIWGGQWRQPMDFMHFQLPRPVAKQLAEEPDPDKRNELWEKHLETCR